MQFDSIDGPHAGALARIFLIIAAFAATGAAAQEVARTPFINAPPRTPGLGGGVRLTGTPYVGVSDEQDLDLVPLYLYEGKWLFAQGTFGGVHLVNRDWLNIDILARYRFTQFDPDTLQLEGLQKRDQTVDAGFRATVKGRWGELEAMWVTDTLDNHNGEQTELNYRYNFDFGRWVLTPWITVQWQDSDLANYYYGISQAEAAASEFDAYNTGSAKNVGWGLNTSFNVSEHIILFANLGTYGFDTGIRDSPIVSEDNVGTLFLGGTYVFGSLESSSRVPQERRGEWTWRINGGYQAEENIVGGISGGDFSGSKDVNTHIAGVTVSKLVMGGPRVDFYGRLALFRHFEDGLQDNFWNYTAYMMAVGKGYLPWSNGEAFRFGFGFGFSYAEKVPIIEQIKQGRRERNTNHFLNYLELTVDFPMKNFLKSRLVNDCYLGVTVVHRSGIFSTSDILGSVAGGSDWITGHVECKR